jgi:hypothetical protein
VELRPVECSGAGRVGDLRGLRGGEGSRELPEDRDLHRWLWLITIVTSIPARLFFQAPVLDHQGTYVTGAGTDAHTLIAIGAVLELLLLIANVGTAVVPYSIHQRVHEAGAVA